MRALFGALLALTWTTSSFADPGRMLAESDTGIVFADLACEAETHQVVGPEFYADIWGYLTAEVKVEITCITSSGETLRFDGGDSVPFLTLRWRGRDQAWYAGDVWVARKSGLRIEMNNALEYTVWTSGDPTHVAFKVEIREAPTP